MRNKTLKQQLNIDDRVYFVDEMYDYHQTYTFCSIGDEAQALKVVNDSDLPSGVGIKIYLKNAGKTMWVDSRLVMPRIQWVRLYNKMAQIIANRAMIK